MTKNRGGAIVRVTPERLAEVQEEILVRFTESMNLGEEPCSIWWGNPKLNWGWDHVYDPCKNGPMGFAWTY